jgi:sporulation protein YlmC with PRC-barrel domain
MMTESQLIGRRVVSQDGHVLGDVINILVDTDAWRVVQLGVRVRRASLERLGLPKPPWLGRRTIGIAIEHVAGVSDAVVLTLRLADLRLPTVDGSPDGVDEETSNREADEPASASLRAR